MSDAAPTSSSGDPAAVTNGPFATDKVGWRRAARHPAPVDGAGSKRRRSRWFELPALVLLAILIAFVAKTFIVQPFYIPSESMEHTLYGCLGCHGDRILVDKPVYDFRAPHPGDIVVFHAPPGWTDEPSSTPPTNPVLRAARGLGVMSRQVGQAAGWR